MRKPDGSLEVRCRRRATLPVRRLAGAEVFDPVHAFPILTCLHGSEDQGVKVSRALRQGLRGALAGLFLIGAEVLESRFQISLEFPKRIDGTAFRGSRREGLPSAMAFALVATRRVLDVQVDPVPKHEIQDGASAREEDGVQFNKHFHGFSLRLPAWSVNRESPCYRYPLLQPVFCRAQASAVKAQRRTWDPILRRTGKQQSFGKVTSHRPFGTVGNKVSGKFTGSTSTLTSASVCGGYFGTGPYIPPGRKSSMSKYQDIFPPLHAFSLATATLLPRASERG